MAVLLSGTTIGGHVAVHANNISTYALTSVPANVITTSGGTLVGSLSFADVADNVRFQKGSNHLNLKDPWSNFHLYIPSGGIYSDAAAYYFRNTSSTVWLSIESGNVQASSSMRAPIFYDSQDTGYYVDPNSNSRLNVVRAYKFENNDSVSTNSTFGIYFGNGDGTPYAIYRAAGSWTHPYPDLRIAFHTGIQIGANASYEGVRFYTDYDMSSQVMSVNNGSDPLGGGNVYVNNNLQAGSSLRAPIFYDSQDTGFYLDPNATSNLAVVNVSTINPTNTYVGNAIYFGGGNNYFNWDGARINSNVGIQSGSDMRAPIFYDSNDTGYYGDFASTSRFSRLLVQQSGVNSTAGPALRVSKGWDNGTPDIIYDTVVIESNDVTTIRMKEADGGTAGWSTGDGNTSFTSNVPMRFYTGGSESAYIYSGQGGTLAMYINNSQIVGIGTSDFSYTANDNSRTVGSTTNNRLFVNGSIQLLGNNDAIVIGRGTATFLSDEELGFGWGGGWYMTESSYIRSRGSKSLHMNGGSVDYVGSLYLEGSVGVHLQPNAGSYGSLQVTGSKDGWHGIRFTGSNVVVMANTNEVGFHNNGAGWQFRWYQGEMYISSGSTGGSTERTVIHSGNIGSQSVSYASSAGNADTVDSLHASSFVRRDTTGQFLKPYQEYESYISNSTLPSELVSNMGGGGLRVDFLNSASFGSWAHTITFSGYNGYNMYQLAGHYKGSGGEGPDLYVRCEPNHGQNSWSSWQKLWHTGHFTDTNISNWNTAYGWGNHANYGYLTSLPSHNHDDRYYTEGESLDLFARRDTNTNINGNLVLGNTAYNQSTAYGNSGAKLFFNGSDSDAQGNYYIGTNHEDYGGNYSKLDLRWHTGIRIGAQPNYGGVRFYNNEDLGTVIFSVGTGDANVRVANSLYVDGSFSVQSGQSIYLSTSADTNWRIGRNLVTESDNSLTGSTMQFIAANVSDQGWQFVNSAGKTIVEISSYTNGGLFVINQKEFWLKQPIGGRLTTIRKKVTDGLSPNNVKIADTSLAAYSANGNPNTYIIIQTLVPQDEYQMGGFTIDLFARYGDTNGKTKIDLGGYWNPEGNGGFTGWEAHGTNPQLKPTIQVGRNVNNGYTAIILSGITWDYPVVVARDLYLGYNSADGAAYGFGWHIYSSPNINDFTNLDTVVWRNAYSDSNPAGYITASANTASASVLATARTLTIGSTGKAFNGSADVSWSLAEIGAQPAGSYLTSLGFSYSTGVNANHVVQRDANGYIYANHINFSTGESENPTINSFITSNGDGWSRKSSLAHVKNSIRGVADGTWSINITGDAGSVDGVDSSAIVYGGAGRASNYVDSMDDPNQKSGFFYKDSPTGQPFGDWWNWLNVAGNSWQSSNNYSFQIAHAFHSDDAYIRRVTNGSLGSWRTLITSGNIGGQSVNYATSAGSASSATNATNANRLDRYTVFYGNDWNTAGVNNKLIASSFHNATGPNKPPVYTYGGMLSYMNSGEDNWQIAIPENQNSAVGKFNSMHYRSGWNGVWSSWRQVLDFTDGLCAIDAPGTVTTRVYSSASGYNTAFASNLEIWGQVDDWAYGKFRFRVQNDPASQPVYGAQFRIERFSVNTGWQLLGMVPRDSQNLEWQGDIMPGLSDGRVKENVTTLTKGLETVKDINAVEFDWIPTAGVSERTGHDIGFIAQELEEIVPEAVYTRTDGYKTVRYEKVVPVLVQAIKDQQSIIDSLISRIEALENK